MELCDEQSLANFFLDVKDPIALLVINEMFDFLVHLLKQNVSGRLIFTEFTNSPDLVPGKSLSSPKHVKIFPMYSLERQGYLNTCLTQVF